MKYSKDFPHPETGKIIKATMSKCCNCSVSHITGNPKKSHYKCNNCGNETTPFKKDMWVITETGQYRKLED